MTISKISRISFALAVALLLAGTRLGAHHSFAAEYDGSKRITITGTVTRFDWMNPHAWLYLDGKDENETVVAWRFEMGSPNGLARRGWKRTDVKIGDQITVEGYRAKDGRFVANAATITIADGRKLFGGFQSTPGPRPK